ncbi:MAG: pyrroloquinoline quinone precursor peptide PqqA [Pseudomonadota bacterium]
MVWTTPEIEEVTCGMEINMYFPAEDEGELFASPDVNSPGKDE